MNLILIILLEIKLTPCNGIKLVENVFLNQSEKFDWPDTAKKEINEKGFCYGLREQIAFLVDGTVVPCCLDKDADINLGNIEKQSFVDIIQGKKAREFLRWLLQNEGC